MSFQYQNVGIADISVAYLGARAGLGIAQLRIGLTFTMSKHTPVDVLVQDIRVRVDVSSLGGGPAVFLGVATNETAWTFTTSPYAPKETNCFDVTLTEGQLARLEELRNGHGLRFRFNISAVATGSSGRQIQQDDKTREVNLSEWAELLNQMGATDYFIVGVPVPPVLDDALSVAVQRLKKAQSALLYGNFDTCIADCRLAMESARKVDPVTEGYGSAAVQRYLAGKASMTKIERERLIEEAALNYCHLAVHATSDGTVEIFGREDALMLMTIASSVVNAAGRRHR